jgi:Ni/Fe-hydrogenase subunit HybB-like protein
MTEFSPVLMERTHWERAKHFLKHLPIPLAIIGATLSSLHQSSLGTLFVVMSERVHPLWESPLLPLLFFISSVAAGLAMVVAGGTVSFWVFKRSLPQKVVGGLASFIPWVLGLYVLIKFLDLFAAGDPILTSGIYSVLFMAELVIGVVIPIVLFSLKSVRESRMLSFIAAAFLLIGIFMNRFDVAWFSLRPIPGYNYFPSIPEILIQVGVIAAVIVVYTLVGHYMPLFEELPTAEETVEQERLQLQRGY